MRTRQLQKRALPDKGIATLEINLHDLGGDFKDEGKIGNG